MRYGTPEYGCDVVCKVTACIQFDWDTLFITYTGKSSEGIRKHVAKIYPNANVTLGEPIWVQR